MKHAFLIIAHEDYRVLEVLLSMLDDERNDVYLHIDKRAEELYVRISAWQMKHAGFCLLRERMNVYWGDISQIQVEYRLFEEAYGRESYLYYHLLSGVDLPLKSQDEIHDFFQENQGAEFVGFWLGKNHERDIKRKVGRYYLFSKWKQDKMTPYHNLFTFCRNMALNLQKPFGYPRPFEYEFKKGPNWVSITQDFCTYLLEHKQEVLKRFRFTCCGDEIFLQTLLWKSPFRSKLYFEGDSEKGCVRKIDWKRGSPYVWTEDDLDELVSSNAMFARKFSSGNGKLIYKIKSYCETL